MLDWHILFKFHRFRRFLLTDAFRRQSRGPLALDAVVDAVGRIFVSDLAGLLVRADVVESPLAVERALRVGPCPVGARRRLGVAQCRQLGARGFGTLDPDHLIVPSKRIFISPLLSLFITICLYLYGYRR